MSSSRTTTTTGILALTLLGLLPMTVPAGDDPPAFGLYRPLSDDEARAYRPPAGVGLQFRRGDSRDNPEAPAPTEASPSFDPVMADTARPDGREQGSRDRVPDYLSRTVPGYVSPRDLPAAADTRGNGSFAYPGSGTPAYPGESRQPPADRFAPASNGGIPAASPPLASRSTTVSAPVDAADEASGLYRRRPEAAPGFGGDRPRRFRPPGAEDRIHRRAPVNTHQEIAGFERPEKPPRPVSSAPSDNAPAVYQGASDARFRPPGVLGTR